MNPSPEHVDDLPEEWIAALRSLGGERAPRALWERVEMARLADREDASAPNALWERVVPEVAEIAAGRQRVPGPAAERPRGRVLPFPLRRVAGLTAAAAAALFLGIAMFSDPAGTTPEGPVLARATAPEAREELRRRILVLEVAPEDLSATARGLAANLGAIPMEEGG